MSTAVAELGFLMKRASVETDPTQQEALVDEINRQVDQFIETDNRHALTALATVLMAQVDEGADWAPALLDCFMDMLSPEQAHAITAGARSAVPPTPTLH